MSIAENHTIAENESVIVNNYRKKYKGWWVSLLARDASPETENLRNVLEFGYGKSSSERIYRYEHGNAVDDRCKTCGNITEFRSTEKGFRKYCSLRCSNNSPDVIIKKKNALVKHFGCHNFSSEFGPRAAEEYFKRVGYGERTLNTRKTLLDKYGEEYLTRIPWVKDKISETKLIRYGDSKYVNPEQISKDIELRYLRGWTNNPKNSWKQYAFPSGTIVKYQGYENFAIDKLLLDELPETDIIIDKKLQPRIFYLYNGKNCRYYLDIFVKSLNKIIEVKSEWSYKLHERRNLAKKEQCLKDGYNFEFWIFDEKKNLTII